MQVSARWRVERRVEHPKGQDGLLGCRSTLLVPSPPRWELAVSQLDARRIAQVDGGEVALQPKLLPLRLTLLIIRRARSHRSLSSGVCGSALPTGRVRQSGSRAATHGREDDASARKDDEQ